MQGTVLGVRSGALFATAVWAAGSAWLPARAEPTEQLYVLFNGAETQSILYVDSIEDVGSGVKRARVVNLYSTSISYSGSESYGSRMWSEYDCTHRRIRGLEFVGLTLELAPLPAQVGSGRWQDIRPGTIGDKELAGICQPADRNPQRFSDASLQSLADAFFVSRHVKEPSPPPA